MSGGERICIYLGREPRAVLILRELRRRYPEAHIVAIVPPGQAVPEEAAAQVTKLYVTPRASYAPWRPKDYRALIRTLRDGRYDRYIIVFETLQQRLLAVFSGAKRREAWCWDNRIRTIDHRVTRLLWREVTGRVCPPFATLWWWLVVCCTRAKTPR